MKLKNALSLIIALLLFQCSPGEYAGQRMEFNIDYEKFVLDNGLEIIFHTDRSDPVVAVALTFHVGSAREKEGRTGFAHLFEHLFFLDSENLGKGGLDKMSSRIGGSGANGSTNRDRTNYFQTVPNDALEKMLWAEADKLGYFINTVTEEVVAKEKQVVKNEKRQSNDNRPYGHANYVVHKNLYPPEHPYSWQVIGSLEDLENSTLADVKEFHGKWYGPNNATLVVAGDFDTEQAKEWIHKYFDEIPGGEQIVKMEKQPTNLADSKLLFYEDNFARVPELRLVWPTVELFHPDSYPLQVLSSLLTEGLTSPFYQVLVKEEQVTSSVNMFNRNSELAGELIYLVRALPDTDLNKVKETTNDAFRKFEEEGFTDEDMSRIMAGMETDFYNGLSSVLGKAFQLARYNIFAGDPGFINQDIHNILAVTRQDIERVYNKYIKDQPFVATSFVPRGQEKLSLDGSTLAAVVEEKIIQGAEDEIVIPDGSEFERTASTFDRTIEPPYGAAPIINTPDIWQSDLGNGINVYGITNSELPLVRFNLRIKGGLLLDDPQKIGVANITAQLVTRGTESKTAEEFEKAIDQLGASINVRAGRQYTTISGNTLVKNLGPTVQLIEEMLLTPRWDPEEFELIKQSVLSQLAQRSASPNAIATKEYNKLIYGESNILSNSILGSEEALEVITIDDVKNYFKNYSPQITDIHVVGDVQKEVVLSIFESLAENWTGDKVEIPHYDFPGTLNKSTVYFYDVPGAKQSVLRFGYMAMEETNPDYYPATIMNYILGGGSFASRLTQELREGKGYTYGIRSSFSGTDIPGAFTISSGVRSNVTLESAKLIKSILDEYPATFTDADLENTKSFLLKSNARSFETLFAKLNMLQKISAYGWTADYVREREDIVQKITKEEIADLARKYANPDKMIYLVIGDAETQMHRLEELGFGDVVILNLPIDPQL